jgi:CubicO group peptidase (beta-lactamase class C family)
MTTIPRRRQFLRQAGAAVCGPWPFPASVSRLQDDGDFADLAAQVPKWMRDNHVVGASVAVLSEGERVWTRGFGWRNLSPRASVADDTVFEAASLSKPVFAYAVMTLAAEAKLDLDRPLVSYLADPFRSRKGVPMASKVPDDPRLKRITPRMVLSHTTGFPNWASGKPLSFQADPGERFGYSGEGYIHLQNVIEHVTGEPLEDFARKRVFAPLGMASSSFIWRDDYEATASLGYDRRGAAEKWKEKQALAAATLHTTASDFARFLEAMLRPGRVGLGEEWIERMLAPRIQVDESLSWGQGWGIERRPRGRAFWQWGDNGEFKAFAIGSREEERAVIVLTNSALGLRLCRRIVEQVLPGPHPALSFGMLQY